MLLILWKVLQSYMHNVPRRNYRNSEAYGSYTSFEAEDAPFRIVGLIAVLELRASVAYASATIMYVFPF
jgi:hypothetical protein